MIKQSHIEFDYKIIDASCVGGIQGLMHYASFLSDLWQTCKHVCVWFVRIINQFMSR